LRGFRVLALAAGGTAAIVLLCWPIFGKPALTGLDPSWRAATHLAHVHDLDWGRDVVLPQGPLGFLAEPMLVAPGATYPLAVVAHAGLLAAWVVALGLLLAPRTGAAVAWIIAALMGGLVLAPLLRNDLWVEAALGLLVLVGLVAVQRARLSIAAAAAFGAAGALLLLVRADAGLVWLALGSVVAATATPADDRAQLLRGAAWRVGAFAAAAALTLVVGWRLSGQPLSALDDWIEAVRELIAGYSGAHALESAPAWHYAAALGLAAALIALAAAAASLPRGRRAPLVALALAVLAVGARQSFIRHDGIHAQRFFLLAAAVALALAAGSAARRAALSAAAIAGVLALAAGEQLNLDLLRADRHAPDAARDLRLVVSPGARDDELRRNRGTILGHYQLPAHFDALARRSTVHVVPWDVALMAALPEARWRPLPVVQDYIASTSALDARNAEAIQAPGRPEVILRRLRVSIDRRLLRFEPPRAALALACRYRETATDGFTGWQVLRPGPSRCGAERPLGIARARLGGVIPIPPARPDEAVVVRFGGIATGFVDRVRTALLRGPRVHLSLRGESSGGSRVARARTAIETQDAPRLLAGPPCVTDTLDGTHLPPVRGVAVIGWPHASGLDVEARFSAMPVDCER
jgi:hypothetical protein